MMIEAALQYAAHGLPVFPCTPGGKHPLTERGFYEATTDEEKIRWWWDRYPDANLAVPTGAPGIDVLDVDTHGGDGIASFRIACLAGLTRGYRAVVATPSGGYHLWYAGSSHGNGSLRGKALDFRGKGGYALVPPSVIDGRPYRFIERRWERSGTCDWEAVRALLSPPRPGPPPPPHPGNPTPLLNFVARLQDGNRNNGFYWACKAAIDNHALVPEEFLNVALMAGFEERHTSGTLRSAMRQS